MQGWLKPGDEHGQAVTLLALQPPLGTLHAKSLLGALGAPWLPCAGTPASPAPSSPRCPTSLCWQSQPDRSECAGAAQDLPAPGGEHPHLPIQKPTQCPSQGLFPLGRAWDESCCSFPLPFRLRQELSAARAGTHFAAALPRVLPQGEPGGKAQPAAPASTAQLTRELVGKR